MVDVILKCKVPFAYIVNQNVAEFTCDECLKTTGEVNQNENFLRCSGKFYSRRKISPLTQHCKVYEPTNKRKIDF